MSFETPKLPEVKFNKNGYEIRTDILDMAKGLVSEEFHSKFHGWELTAERDEKSGKYITKIDMPELRKFINSACASNKTDSGKTAGPALKLWQRPFNI